MDDPGNIKAQGKLEILYGVAVARCSNGLLSRILPYKQRMNVDRPRAKWAEIFNSDAIYH